MEIGRIIFGEVLKWNLAGHLLLILTRLRASFFSLELIFLTRFFFNNRYRVLDTRANYVILHDNRLFNKSLHYLWKRIVNVVFIKEYVGIKRTGDNIIKMPWFELSTVPFPSPIQNVFVPRRLDIWRKSKFRTGNNQIFKTRIK